MDKVSNYISDLLSEKKTLVVQGLGSFKKEETPAYFDEKENVFHPSKSTLSFSEKQKNDSSDFAYSISNASGLSLQEAEELIAEFVSGIKKGISENNEFQVAGLGRFYLGEDYSLLFEQDQTLVLKEETFGLPDIPLPHKRYESATKLTETTSDSKVIEDPSLSKVKYGTPETVSVEIEKKGSAGSIILWSLVVVLAVTAAYLIYSLVGDKKEKLPAVAQETEQVSPSEGTTSEENVVSENNIPSEAEKPIEVAKPKTQEAKATVKDAPKTETKKATSKQTNSSVYIIVGSFGVPDNAFKLRAELLRKGYEAEVLDPVPPKKLYKVSIGQFETEAEGKEFISQHQKEFKDPLFLLK